MALPAWAYQPSFRGIVTGGIAPGSMRHIMAREDRSRVGRPLPSSPNYGRAQRNRDNAVVKPRPGTGTALRRVGVSVVGGAPASPAFAPARHAAHRNPVGRIFRGIGRGLKKTGKYIATHKRIFIPAAAAGLTLGFGGAVPALRGLAHGARFLGKAAKIGRVGKFLGRGVVKGGRALLGRRGGRGVAAGRDEAFERIFGRTEGELIDVSGEYETPVPPGAETGPPLGEQFFHPTFSRMPANIRQVILSGGLQPTVAGVAKLVGHFAASVAGPKRNRATFQDYGEIKLVWHIGEARPQWGWDPVIAGGGPLNEGISELESEFPEEMPLEEALPEEIGPEALPEQDPLDTYALMLWGDYFGSRDEADQAFMVDLLLNDEVTATEYVRHFVTTGETALEAGFLDDQLAENIEIGAF